MGVQDIADLDPVGQRRFQMTALFSAFVALGVLLILSLARTDWQLIYTLDDPYIHLALAENILRGGYGVNLSEFSSPSSSILFPLLLALPEGLGIGEWGPFLLNALAALTVVWILSGFLWRYCLSAVSAISPAFSHGLLALAPALVFALNLPSLVMAGLEHPLHALSCLAVIVGLVRTLEEKRPPLSFSFAILLVVLLRFEGLALALAALATLFLLGYWRHALLSFAALAAVLAAYALIMSKLGLPPLPSSVLVKSGASSAVLESNLLNFLRDLRNNVLASAHNRWGLTYLATIALLGTVVLTRWRGWRGQPLVIATVLAALGAHVLFLGFAGAKDVDRYNAVWRYEVYAETLAIAGLAFLPHLFAEVRWIKRALALLACSLLLFLAIDNVKILRRAPAAAENIYLQQYQMHRFATQDFARAVAVNDLGWTAYQNDAYVLDLWGLGSEEARKLRQGPDAKPEAIAALAQRKKVHYAMVYDLWLGWLIPDDWCRMALLITPKVTAASPFVSFYLIERTEEATFLAALSQFKARLPEGSAMILGSCDKPIGD